MTGKQSLLFDKDVYVRCAATVVGKKEADGPLGEMFDVAVEDDMFGKKSWVWSVRSMFNDGRGIITWCNVC